MTSEIEKQQNFRVVIKLFPFLRVTTFGQLKPRLINIMMSALQIETDSQNTHMLLGGLLLCVQDAVNFEEVDSGASDVQSSSARETNLLSSGEIPVGDFFYFTFVSYQ